MAYKVVRVQIIGWRQKFQDAEDDVDFDADSYPGLDDYLCTMEQRGWSVAGMTGGASNGAFLYITLHRPES
ncbi:MAG: hypothetical protein LBI33_02750 [Propionibacteriaceae bacterium]|jgi:hypothetical protein|nr:hypothetical protein [Propionibacteriaceae bacterium]